MSIILIILTITVLFSFTDICIVKKGVRNLRSNANHCFDNNVLIIIEV